MDLGLRCAGWYRASRGSARPHSTPDSGGLSSGDSTAGALSYMNVYPFVRLFGVAMLSHFATVAFAQFTAITNGPVVTDHGDSTGCAWGDYDNDGYLDLFVSNFGTPFNYLYRNN